jgi:hypothetical protein
MSDCRVYWGSHGCELGRGHPEPDRHVCADDGGLCSEIRWTQDPRTGLWVWDWRFSTDGVVVDPGQAFPAAVWGEDLPADRQTDHDAAELVHALRQSAGELPVMRDGKWVRAGDGSAWPGWVDTV